MAEIIIMPKLGFNMDEGQLVKWHRRVGETVKKGEVLFEINTDKTTMPVVLSSEAVIKRPRNGAMTRMCQPRQRCSVRRISMVILRLPLRLSNVSRLRQISRQM